MGAIASTSSRHTATAATALYSLCTPRLRELRCEQWHCGHTTNRPVDVIMLGDREEDLTCQPPMSVAAPGSWERACSSENAYRTCSSTAKVHSQAKWKAAHDARLTSLRIGNSIIAINHKVTRKRENARQGAGSGSCYNSPPLKREAHLPLQRTKRTEGNRGCGNKEENKDRKLGEWRRKDRWGNARKRGGSESGGLCCPRHPGARLQNTSRQSQITGTYTTLLKLTAGARSRQKFVEFTVAPGIASGGDAPMPQLGFSMPAILPIRVPPFHQYRLVTSSSNKMQHLLKLRLL